MEIRVLARNRIPGHEMRSRRKVPAFIEIAGYGFRQVLRIKTYKFERYKYGYAPGMAASLDVIQFMLQTGVPDDAGDLGRIHMNPVSPAGPLCHKDRSYAVDLHIVIVFRARGKEELAAAVLPVASVILQLGSAEVLPADLEPDREIPAAARNPETAFRAIPEFTGPIDGIHGSAGGRFAHCRLETFL